jgi:citrate lyase beta subunit
MTLDPHQLHALQARLKDTNDLLRWHYPGESGRRQPVHTVYGGAHLFAADTAAKLGSQALRALATHAPDAATFARAIGLSGDGALANAVYSRVTDKLAREPVEDFRIDFEDGYGNRPDAEEDGHAESSAREVAAGMKKKSLPPFIGVRIKPLSAELALRSMRTLDLFLSRLARETGGVLPDGFAVTLPKITSPEQVRVLVDLFEAVETGLGLARGVLKMELMIETTQSIVSAQGQTSLPLLLEAAQNRCIAAHFGTYDYTASCNITAAHQHMAHAACDFARNFMQIAFAGTGIWLSDGATNVMPVGPHRAPLGGELSAAQTAENRATVHAAWRLHAQHIWHSLENGFYQGWDLHPAQLPTRYAAVYAFFLQSLDAATRRLANFLDKAAQATLVGDVFDDAATGPGLLNYFLRGLGCGALSEKEALTTGITLDELRGRSFVKILENRRRPLP